MKSRQNDEQSSQQQGDEEPAVQQSQQQAGTNQKLSQRDLELMRERIRQLYG
jgi:uncharacterized FlaG/YvyC family protein